jgi:hypothetical protein
MARSERSQYRKTQQMIEQTHGGNAGRSIFEMLREQLGRAAGRYIESMTEGTQKDVLIARGEVRGLARAVALMQNPYYPTRDIKALEREAVEAARAKEKTDAAE